MSSTFDISNFEFCKIWQYNFEISKVYTIMLQRYSDEKIRVWCEYLVTVKNIVILMIPFEATNTQKSLPIFYWISLFNVSKIAQCKIFLDLSFIGNYNVNNRWGVVIFECDIALKSRVNFILC